MYFNFVVKVKVIVKMIAVKMRKRGKNTRNPVRKRKENLVISQRKGNSLVLLLILNF